MSTEWAHCDENCDAFLSPNLTSFYSICNKTTQLIVESQSAKESLSFHSRGNPYEHICCCALASYTIESKCYKWIRRSRVLLMLCTNKQMKKTHTEHGSCLFLFACHPCATDVCFVYTFLLHFQLHFFVVVVAAAALFCSVCSISIDSGKREREKKRIYSRLLDEFNSSRYPDHVKVSMQTERKTEKKFPWKK